MKKGLCLFSSSLLLSAGLFAQWPYLSAIPNGDNKKAIITEQVGLADISIAYHRPGVKGREGKIWGQLIPEGFVKQGFGTDKPAPWRAGANENTIFECGDDITVEGHPLPKGKYALFVAYGPAESVVVFSKKTDAWGSYFYDEKDDALRVKVKPFALGESVERLRYEFMDQTPNSAMVTLEWEKLAIPFKIEVDYLKEQFEAIHGDLKNPRGFTYQALTKGAAWCLENNYRIEDGLAWINLATDSVNGFGGHNVFGSLSVKAQLLERSGKGEEAAAVMRSAMPVATMIEIHQYGRQLLATKKAKEALEIFKLNYKKYPGVFVTNAGMARGLSANGDHKEALKYAQKALLLAPDEGNKKVIQTMVEKLKKDQDLD